MTDFSTRLLAWFERHGRKDLPWQHDPTPYRVWVSEIMLQQTQVAAVIPYFQRFMQNFPSVTALAAADLDEVLHLWSGLGYYARARNLHRSATIIVDKYAGVFPRAHQDLCALPGIGRSTAAAVLALCWGARHTILDGNVKRVLARYHEIGGDPNTATTQRHLWERAEAHTPERALADYTQAIMDLGATVCVRSRPRCGACPLSDDCQAYAHGTQADYPARRARKALPLKHTRLLIARDPDGHVLLQRRPPCGVWGGLWVFPEVADDVDSWCARHQLRPLSDATPRDIVQHTFTHFRLSITPIAVSVKPLNTKIMDSDQWLWYNVKRPAKVGLAKPVKDLLRTHFS